MSRGMEQLPGEQGRVHEQQLLTRKKQIIFIKNIVVLRKITNFAAGLQTKNNNIMMEIMIILWLIGVIFGASQGRK